MIADKTKREVTYPLKLAIDSINEDNLRGAKEFIQIALSRLEEIE